MATWERIFPDLPPNSWPPTVETTWANPLLPIQYHQWLRDNTVKIKLMKMGKGYQWEISCEGVNDEEVIERIRKVDQQLRFIWQEGKWTHVPTGLSVLSSKTTLT